MGEAGGLTRRKELSDSEEKVGPYHESPEGAQELWFSANISGESLRVVSRG